MALLAGWSLRAKNTVAPGEILLPGQNWIKAPRIPPLHFGAGTAFMIPAFARGMEAEVVVIVTDDDLNTKTHIIANLQGELTAAGLTVVVFAGVHANPTIDDVAAGVEVVTHSTARGRKVIIVAIGGGSVLDAAKAIAIAATNMKRLGGLDYGEYDNPAIPIIAVPTTHGTGSHVNDFGVFTDPVTGIRYYIGHSSCLAVASILDRDLTLGLPASVTASSGLDAFVHGLESWLSVHSNLWSEPLALAAMRTIAAYLPVAYDHGTNRDARTQLLMASHQAGCAMASSRLGLVHAIGHALGGKFNIAHGDAMALVLVPVLRFYQDACQERLASIAHLVGCQCDFATDAAHAEITIQKISELVARLHMDRRLSSYFIGPEHYPAIAAAAVADEVNEPSPVAATEADIIDMLGQVA